MRLICKSKSMDEREEYQEYLLKIEVFDASGKSLGIEYAVGEKRKDKFEVSLPSVFDYPANYFEGSYKVLSHSIINQ